MLLGHIVADSNEHEPAKDDEDAAVEPFAKEFHLGSDFATVDQATWAKLVEKEIKDTPFLKRMVSQTYEGIALQPLYTEATFATGGDP